MKFEILRSGAEFYWRLNGANGKALCHSENYKNKADAQQTIVAIIGGAADAEIVDSTSVSTRRDDERRKPSK